MNAWQIVKVGIVLSLPLLCSVGRLQGQSDSGQDTQSTTNYCIYVVEKGDTIDRISRMWGVSPRELKKVNSLPDYTEPIVGDRIKIPNISDISSSGGNEEQQECTGIFCCSRSRY
jgi:LysM repeat protein